MAKCVKNARDYINRDAALEMEARPPFNHQWNVRVTGCINLGPSTLVYLYNKGGV